jgi:GTP-binding protein
MNEVLNTFEGAPLKETDVDDDKFLGITVLGRPNVGKSTLINRLIGEDRLVVFDQPGTTRDSIAVPFESNKTKYMLFDTAGVRRKAKVRETIEKFSIVKALRSMEKAHVVLVLMDAQEGITEQDVSLIGLTVQRGRSLVVVVNKWDGLTATKKKQIKEQIDRRLPFLDFAEQHTISALYGKGVDNLLPAVLRAYKSATINLSTKELTNALERAIQQHPPPLARGRRIRLRYAHQGGRNPPIIVIHGNQTKQLPNSYRRYLINYFRKKFNLHGTPVQLFFKTGDNPYKGRKNELTHRQKRKRQRLMKHVKKK